jgi:hypothetical protein
MTREQRKLEEKKISMSFAEFNGALEMCLGLASDVLFLVEHKFSKQEDLFYCNIFRQVLLKLEN